MDKCAQYVDNVKIISSATLDVDDFLRFFDSKSTDADKKNKQDTQAVALSIQVSESPLSIIP